MTSVVESVSNKVECHESIENSEKVKKSNMKKKDPTPAETAARQKKQQAEKEKKHKQQQQSQPRRHRNKKQNGSWKKLDVDINFNKPNRGSNGNSSSGNSKRRGGKSRGAEKGKGRGSKQRSNNKAFKGVRYNDGCQHYHPELHLQDAIRQIEYFFSMQELSRNPYIRRNMDCNGYIPAAIIFNFPSVANYCIPYHHLINAIDNTSQTLIVDNHNQTLRLKNDWQRWLYPNPDGTSGCAPWIISNEQHQHHQEQQYPPQDSTEPADNQSEHNDNPDDNDSSNNSSASTHPCTDSDAEST